MNADVPFHGPGAATSDSPTTAGPLTVGGFNGTGTRLRARMPLPQIEVVQALNWLEVPEGNGATAAFSAASVWLGVNEPSDMISAAPADTTGAAMLVPGVARARTTDGGRRAGIHGGQDPLAVPEDVTTGCRDVQRRAVVGVHVLLAVVLISGAIAELAGRADGDMWGAFCEGAQQLPMLRRHQNVPDVWTPTDAAVNEWERPATLR